MDSLDEEREEEDDESEECFESDEESESESSELLLKAASPLFLTDFLYAASFLALIDATVS